MTLQHLCKNLSYHPVISRPQSEPVPWQGRVGYVQDLWQNGGIVQKWGFAPSPKNTHIFLCGSPQMIDDTVTMLQNEGYSEHTKKTPGQIHVERYW